MVTAGGLLALGKDSVGVQVGEDLETGTEQLLFLKRVPSSTAFGVVGRALHEGMPWAARLPERHLPHELEDGDVPFERFIDDLANAAMRCPNRRAHSTRKLNLEPGTGNLEPGTAARSAAPSEASNSGV